MKNKILSLMFILLLACSSPYKKDTLIEHYKVVYVDKLESRDISPILRKLLYSEFDSQMLIKGTASFNAKTRTYLLGPHSSLTIVENGKPIYEIIYR